MKLHQLIKQVVQLSSHFICHFLSLLWTGTALVTKWWACVNVKKTKTASYWMFLSLEDKFQHKGEAKHFSFKDVLMHSKGLKFQLHCKNFCLKLVLFLHNSVEGGPLPDNPLMNVTAKSWCRLITRFIFQVQLLSYYWQPTDQDINICWTLTTSFI